MASLKEDRLQIRVDPTRKHLIEEAAEATHLSVSSFVLQAASSAAQDVLAERAVVALSPDGAERFLGVLRAPVEHSDALAVALARPVKVDWID